MHLSVPWPKNEKMTAQTIQKRLKKLGNKERAASSQRFFKTGPGEYGEGDVFIGVRVPVLRTLVKEYADLSVEQIIILLRSHVHEERLLALLLVDTFSKGDEAAKKSIYEVYLKNTGFVNNCDLRFAYCLLRDTPAKSRQRAGWDADYTPTA